MNAAAWEDSQVEPDPRPRLPRPRLLLIISGAGIIILLLSSIFASYLAPYDPLVIGPAELQPPTPEHPFGTDQVGRDILSRVIFGSRLSLLISAGVISLTLMIGLPVGTLAAMTGGWIDEILMRLTDVFFAFPYLILAMAIIATLGTGTTSLILALGVVWSWVNESGELVLTDKDADRLAQEPYAVLDKINAKIRKINGLLEETQKTAVEDAKKNSEPTPSEDFGMS